MVGTGNRIVACSGCGMAAHQWTRRLRTTFPEMDVVVYHHRRPGSTSYRSGWSQPDRCCHSKGEGDCESAWSNLIKSIHHRGAGLCGCPADSHHRSDHISDEEVDTG